MFYKLKNFVLLFKLLLSYRLW